MISQLPKCSVSDKLAKSRLEEATMLNRSGLKLMKMNIKFLGKFVNVRDKTFNKS
jgi:hypothetical protein